MGKKIYDVMIVGGGGAGLTAALYASRANLSTILFEKLISGAGQSWRNYRTFFFHFFFLLLFLPSFFFSA